MSNEALLDSPVCCVWCYTPAITHRRLSQGAKPARAAFQDHVSISNPTKHWNLGSIIYKLQYTFLHVSNLLHKWILWSHKTFSSSPTQISIKLLPMVISSQPFPVPLLKILSKPYGHSQFSTTPALWCPTHLCLHLTSTNKDNFRL